MNILGIDSSAQAASVALVSDGILKAQEFSQNGLTHSVTLLPMVQSVLDKASLDISQIDLFTVSMGPGSFSGLRIGVTVAKTLAYGTNKKVLGISTLEALAMNLPFCDRIICPIMDARRDQFYNALYKWENGSLMEIKAPRAISAEDLVKEIKEDVCFVGDGVFRFKDYLKEALGEKASFAPAILCATKAENLCYLSMGEEGIDPAMLNPMYLRLSQAEREYIEKNGEGI